MHWWRLGAGVLSALIAIVPCIVSLTELCHCPSIPSDGKKKVTAFTAERLVTFYVGDLTLFPFFLTSLPASTVQNPFFPHTLSVSFSSPSSIFTQLISSLPPLPLSLWLVYQCCLTRGEALQCVTGVSKASYDITSWVSQGMKELQWRYEWSG